MSDLVMFPGKEEFMLRHTVEDTKPSSELTISNKTFLKNSNSAMENLVHTLFYKQKELIRYNIFSEHTNNVNFIHGKLFITASFFIYIQEVS
jgi:hypothetical protein